MTRKPFHKIVLVIVVILVVIWHFWSLQYSPLPWFDETFFASITHSLMNGQGFHLAVCPIQTNGEQVLIYGPVYFLLTTLSSSIFGFGIMSIRMVNLIGAIISLFIFYRIIRQLSLPTWVTISVTLLLMFDFIFNQNAHSGRMDLLALAFFLGAILIHVRDNKKDTTPFLIGLLGTLAVLTTLRIAVFVLPFFTTLFTYNLLKHNWRHATILLLTSITLYGIWIWWGFGSISSFIQEYTVTKNEIDPNRKNLISSFVGGNFQIPFYQIPLVVIGSISVLFMLIKKTRLSNAWVFILPIPFFYLFVKDTGAYSAMLVPFWYFSIAIAVSFVQRQYTQTKRLLYPLCTVIVLLFMVNISTFLFKSITIICTKTERDPKPLVQWIEKHIPEGSRVVGDDRYYYACIQNHSDFQYMDRIGDHLIRARYHSKEFKPDFLFISTQTSPEIINAYKSEFEFGDQWEYKPKKTNDKIQKLISLLPMPIQSSYQGTLIKVSSK